MSKLDNIHTFVWLLNECEFTVSPILEYAIKEKLEQFSLDNVSPYSINLILKGTSKYSI